MSTTAQVRAAWDLKLWADATIKAVTPQIFNFDLQDIAEISTAHAAKMYYNQKINFVAARFGRSVAFGQTMGLGTGAVITCTYPVFIKYYRDAQEDLSGAAYNAVEDFIGTLISRMAATLGDTWNSTVDYWLPQEGMASIGLELLDDKPAWVGGYSFTGYKQTSL